jgi:chromosome partitioning protein
MQRVLVANRKGGCGKTLVSITLASALAAAGGRVALADADPQKSSLRWLKRRPEGEAAIRALDWSDGSEVGEAPKKLDWLVVDAPGALHGAGAEALVAEADVVVVPVLPSVFDADSTKRFLARIEEIGRVRKGRASVLLVANRLKARARATDRLDAFLAELGRQPVARIAERAIYGEMAERGLALFDRRQARLAGAKGEWQPLVAALAPG